MPAETAKPISNLHILLPGGKVAVQIHEENREIDGPMPTARAGQMGRGFSPNLWNLYANWTPEDTAPYFAGFEAVSGQIQFGQRLINLAGGKLTRIVTDIIGNDLLPQELSVLWSGMNVAEVRWHGEPPELYTTRHLTMVHEQQVVKYSEIPQVKPHYKATLLGICGKGILTPAAHAYLAEVPGYNHTLPGGARLTLRSFDGRIHAVVSNSPDFVSDPGNPLNPANSPVENISQIVTTSADGTPLWIDIRPAHEQGGYKLSTDRFTPAVSQR